MSRRSDIVSTAATAVVVAVIAYFAYSMRDVILLACGAAICAVALMPLIDRLRRVELGSWRPGGTGAVLIIILGIAEIALMLSALAPSSLIFVHRIFATMQATYSTAFASWISELPDARADIIRGHVARATAVILIWAMLAIWLRRYGRATLRRTTIFLPSRIRPALVAAVERTIEHHDEWIVREITLMLIAGVSAFMMLGILGVKDFHLLAIFAGAASLFPPAGLMLAMTTSALIAGADSTFKLIGVLAFFAVYSELESSYLRPRLDDGRVVLPLLALVVALMLGMTTAGLAGAIVALPAAAIASIIVGSFVIRAPTLALPLDPCAACELRGLSMTTQTIRLPVAIDSIADPIDAALPVAASSSSMPRAVQMLALMLTYGTATLLILAILDVQHAYVLAAIIALAEVVPVIGPLSAMLLCAVVAGADSTYKVAALLGFFAVYPQIEVAFLEPRIADRRVAAGVAIVCVSMIIGLVAWGVIGGLLAIPIAISASIIVASASNEPQRANLALDSKEIYFANRSPL